MTKIFSPTCECDTNFAAIRFRLRKAERLTLSIVDEKARRTCGRSSGPCGGSSGRGLARPGTGDVGAGAVVPDGAYRARVHLGYRTIFMPNRIRVDTTPPVVQVAPRRAARPRAGEAAEGSLSRRRAGSGLRLPERQARPAGGSTRLKWKVEGPVRARPGKYRVTVTARDCCGQPLGRVAAGRRHRPAARADASRAPRAPARASPSACGATGVRTSGGSGGAARTRVDACCGFGLRSSRAATGS